MSWIGPLLVACSAALYAMSFPPVSLTWLGWLALAPLFAAVRRSSPKQAFVLGCAWCGLASYGVAGFLAETISAFFGLPAALGWLGFVVVIAFIAPLYGVYAAWLAWLEARGRCSAIAAAAGFGLCEVARAQMGVVGAWGLLAYSQVPNPHAIQILDGVGSFGLGMIMAATSFLLASGLLDAARPRRLGRAALASVAILGAVLGYGDWRLGGATETGTPVSVALVQSGFERGVRGDPDGTDQSLAQHLALTRLVSGTRPDLIVWPEYAVDFYLREDSPERRLLLESAAAWDADLLLGGPHYRSRFSPTRYHNSAFLIRGGRFAGRYDKVALLPFAESNPFQGVLPRAVHYTAGQQAQPLKGRVPIGTFLCSEVLDPGIARQLAVAGARVLVNPASDDWFLAEAPSRILLATAAARAVENRRYLVRSSQTGSTVIIDPYGAALAEGPPAGAGVVTGEISAFDTRTLYQRMGESHLVLACVFSLATTFRAGRSGRMKIGGSR
jgi:apolipoprotein N-acyltransferase